MSYSLFIAISLRALKVYFCMATAKGRSFIKYLERRKLWAGFCLSLGWLHISEKKIIENCNYVGAGTHKGGKGDIIKICI